MTRYLKQCIDAINPEWVLWSMLIATAAAAVVLVVYAVYLKIFSI